MRNLLNKVAIAFAQPILAKRDTFKDRQAVSYRLFAFLGKAARYVFYQTMQTRHGFTRNIQGVWLKERDDATFIYCLRGYYGFAYSQHIRSLKKPFTYLDIGANMGLYSLIALKNKNCVHVHSFDPDPLTIPYLRDNLAHTSSAHVTVHPYAVSNQSGSGTFFAQAPAVEGNKGLPLVMWLPHR